MKSTLIAFCLLLASVIAFSQATEGTVNYLKSLQPAAVIELPYPPDVVSAAMNNYLTKKGRSRSGDVKGFSTFRNTASVSNDSINADLNFKIERRTRKDREATRLSLMITNPGTVPLPSVNSHHLTMEQGKVYLNQLAPAIAAYHLEGQIDDENDAIIRAEAKLKKLEAEGTDLEEKKTGIEKKITDNKQDQAAQLNTIRDLKQKLADRVGQRKTK